MRVSKIVRYTIYIFLFSIICVLPSTVSAQSCSDYYFRQTVNKSQCPSNKACGTPCIDQTATDTVSCSYSGAACLGNIQPGSEVCNFGPRDVNGNCSCTVDISAVGLVPICSACPYGAWTNQGCGAGGCVGTQMYQSRSSSTAQSVCETQYRCVSSASCGPPPTTCAGGSYCNGSPVINSTIGQVICGGGTCGTGNCEYLCTSSGNWFPNGNSCNLCTGTPTPAVPRTCAGGFYCDGTPVVGTPGQIVCGLPDGGGICRTSQCNGSTGVWDYLGGACSMPTSTPTPIVIPPTLTPTPTLIAFPYYKVKDASFYKLGNLTSPIALGSSTVYDSSDTAANVFNQGASGIVAAQGAINVGTGTVSSSGWSKASQSIPSSFTAASFKDYVVTRKAVTTITSLAQITASGIYYYNGDLTIASDIAVNNVVLVVNGNVTLVGTGGATKTFNTATPRSFALVVAGTPTSPKTLTFADTLTEAHGVFVADDIQFSANEVFPSSTPLKIVGNVSSSSGVSVMRERSSTKTAASLFIVFDPTVYVSLFDKLSIVKSSWTQIQ